MFTKARWDKSFIFNSIHLTGNGWARDQALSEADIALHRQHFDARRREIGPPLVEEALPATAGGV